MERVAFPGLCKKISHAKALFINDRVICSLDREFTWLNQDADNHATIGELIVYRREKQETICIEQQFRDHLIDQRLFTHNNSLFYKGRNVHGDIQIAKMMLVNEKTLEFKFLETRSLRPWLNRDFIGLYEHYENGAVYGFPMGRYCASFISKGRLFMLRPNLRKVFSTALNNGLTYIEHSVASPQLGLHDYFDAYVVDSTVFLLSLTPRRRQFLKLDLRTFQLTDVTAELPPTLTKAQGYGFHKTWLYCTSRKLNEGELFRLDLNRLINTKQLGNELQQQSSPPSLECPVCFEPLIAPKVFPECGHSICVDCERMIAVDDLHAKTKTLRCPECCTSTVIGIEKSLPTNWALKKQENPDSSERKETLECDNCKEMLSEEKTFTCALCAQTNDKLEILLCGACALKNHTDHISKVKPAVFADEELRKRRLGHISRDPEDPKREERSLGDQISQQVKQELTVFFADLQENYNDVIDRVTKVMTAGSITQTALESETDKVLDNELNINTKIQKLADWKKGLVDQICKLNDRNEK